MASGMTEKFINIGTKMLQEDRNNEGISVMCVATLIGGVAVFVSSIISSFHIVQFVHQPGNYLLNLILLILSLSIIVVELSSTTKFNRYRAKIQEFAKVLTLSIGKAIFCLYIGIMCLTLSSMASLYIAVGLYMIGIGGSHLMIALRKDKEERQTSQNGREGESENIEKFDVEDSGNDNIYHYTEN